MAVYKDVDLAVQMPLSLRAQMLIWSSMLWITWEIAPLHSCQLDFIVVKQSVLHPSCYPLNQYLSSSAVQKHGIWYQRPCWTQLHGVYVLSLLTGPIISSQKAIRLALEFWRRWLLSRCLRIKSVFALSQTRLKNKLPPPSAYVEFKSQRSQNIMIVFPIDTQIQNSLALSKVLMALHSDPAHFQLRSLISVCRRSKVVYRGTIMFPQDARVHIVKGQRKHLCVSTEQCVNPCYACSHYFHALPMTLFLHRT